MRLWKTKKDKKIEELQLRIDELAGMNLLLRPVTRNVVRARSVFTVDENMPTPAAWYIQQELARNLSSEIAKYMKITAEENGGQRRYVATLGIVEEN